MPIPFTQRVQQLPASTPFVGPETLERQAGRHFKARIGANESAFGQSPKAIAAMQAVIEQGHCSWYGDPENAELRQTLASKHGVHPDEIVVDAGIDALLGLTVRMLMETGETAVTSDGAYPTFNYHVAGFGGQLQKVPYLDNHEHPEALLMATREHQAKLTYFANPDNPMGTCHSASTVQTLIDNLPAHTLLLLDEAYTEFADDSTAPAMQADNPQLIRYRTFSKAYGMAGMRIGYAIAHKDLITGFNKIRNHFACNKLAQVAALASLQDPDFLSTVATQVQQGRRIIAEIADQHGLPYLPSSTNFVALNMGSASRAQAVLAELNQRGVFMRMPGVSPLNQYIRVGIGTREEMDYFAGAFAESLKALT